MEKLPEKTKEGILIAFGEIFLKSEGVRKLFQKKLSKNICFFLDKKGIDFEIDASRERIFVKTEEIDKATEEIKKVFGIVWLAKSFYFPEISLEEFSSFIDKNYKKWIKKDETFGIRFRMEKNILKENRDDVIKRIAKNIKRKVDLTNPQIEIFIEIRKEGTFLYFKKQKGAGGFPIGGSGKILSLISGGIDSPVASYLIAKRGAENVWLNFHSVPLTSKQGIEKIKELAKVFLNYQPHLKVYFIPFHKAQLEIKEKAPIKYRILLYRRLMLKIAEEIAEKENCEAIVTGDSLGQVASQTLPNIKIIQDAIDIPILRPLIGKDKEEIIELARAIGTFEISIEPYEDCCSVFAPKPQTAEGKLETIKEIEKKIESAKIIKEAIESSDVIEN
ncbi:MAG: tRNA uracil 4-sulfurtransferase ThiI [Patescibacteria group bacterium]|nr:tRNA uracil 4-sulfurtransferase ThiI [Patescibacteria group bacterium]